MQLLIPISVGELIDKITILKIKQQKASDKQKLANVNHELDELEATWNKSKPSNVDISALQDKLTQVNEALWAIEG